MSLIFSLAIAFAIANSPIYVDKHEVVLSSYQVPIAEEFKWDAVSSLEAINKIKNEDDLTDVDSTLLTYLGVDSFELKLLSQVVWGESRSNKEPEYGQQLVAQTVMNRLVRNYGGNNTIEGVIYSKSQFSSTTDDGYGTYTGREIRNSLLALYERGQGTCDEIDYDIVAFVATKEINVKRYAKKFGYKIAKVVGGHTFFVKKGE